MREVALELIKKSAASASARLQFCRLAFGAAGSAGASIDTGDAEAVARGLLATEKTSLAWNARAPARAQEQGQAAAQPLPDRRADHPARRRHHRRSHGEGDGWRCASQAKGATRGCSGVADSCRRAPRGRRVDAHTIQPYFAGLVARECGMEVAITLEAESVTFEARPSPA